MRKPRNATGAHPYPSSGNGGNDGWKQRSTVEDVVDAAKKPAEKITGAAAKRGAFYKKRNNA